MTPTRDETTEIEHDDAPAQRTININLARYVGRQLEAPEAERTLLIAADELVVGSDFP